MVWSTQGPEIQHTQVCALTLVCSEWLPWTKPHTNIVCVFSPHTSPKRWRQLLSWFYGHGTWGSESLSNNWERNPALWSPRLSAKHPIKLSLQQKMSGYFMERSPEEELVIFSVPCTSLASIGYWAYELLLRIML